MCAAFRERPFDVFVSHSHANRAVVRPLVEWLRDAGFQVWFDDSETNASSALTKQLEEGIANSKALLVLLSKESVASTWVEKEVDAAFGEQRSHRDFRVIAVRIDDCTVSRFLNNTPWIDLPEGKLTFAAATKLLLGLQYAEIDLDVTDVRDVYGAMSWRDELDEVKLADTLCPQLAAAGFRIVGDSKDQRGFLGGDRVRTIMQGCGGMVAILPHRVDGNTSPYMISEMSIAHDLKLPIIVFAEPEVIVPPPFDARVIRISRHDRLEGQIAITVRDAVRAFQDAWRPPEPQPFAFLSTDFDESRRDVLRVVCKLAQRVLGVPCIIGDEFRDGDVASQIIERIGNALLVVADISGTNLNTCIEAGIALGAKRRLLFLRQGQRSSKDLPFMFGNRQVRFYKDDVDLLAVLRKAIFPFRRAVIANPAAR